jgi:hypothetical protein
MKAKIDKAKRGLELEKSELARLKSLKNVKLSKLEEEKVAVRNSIKQQDKKYQLIIESLNNDINSTQSSIDALKKTLAVKGILKRTGSYDQKSNHLQD